MKAAGLLAVALLVSCGERARDRNAFSIDLTDTGLFAPATLRVPLGASVVFRNLGTQPREVYYRPGDLPVSTPRPAGAAPLPTPPLGTPPPPANAAPWRSGVLYPGETWAHTFTAAGAYLFESPYAPGFPGTPSARSGGDLPGGPPRQVPVGVIVAEAAAGGSAGSGE